MTVKSSMPVAVFCGRLSQLTERTHGAGRTPVLLFSALGDRGWRVRIDRANFLLPEFTGTIGVAEDGSELRGHLGYSSAVTLAFAAVMSTLALTGAAFLIAGYPAGYALVGFALLGAWMLWLAVSAARHSLSLIRSGLNAIADGQNGSNGQNASVLTERDGPR